MDLSILLARIIGLTMVVLYGGFLLNRKFYTYENLSKQPFLILLSGLIGLILGLLLIQLHPAWTPDWKSIITAFGWLLFVSGLVRLLAPRLFLKIADYFSRHQDLASLLAGVFVVVGLYLSYIGYIAK